MMRNLLQAIERALSWHCLTTLQMDIEQVRAIIVGDVTRRALDEFDLQRQMNVPLQRSIWGRYLGREKEFFMACAKVVEPLSWNDVMAIAGADVRAMAAVVKHSFHSLPQLPPTLRRGQAPLALGSDSVRVSSPGGYEHIDVPLAALTKLGRVEGKPVATAVSEMAADGIPITMELVLKLYNFNVLVADE